MKNPNPRIRSALEIFAQHKIDALLVNRDVNIHYLTEFPAHESWLLITPRKTFYITDFRYILEAQKGLKGIGIVQYKKSLHETLWQLAEANKIKALGFDERHVTLAQYKILAKDKPRGIHLAPANGLVEDLREIKEKKEVDLIRQALRIHAEALEYIKDYIKPGATEQQVLFKLEMFVKAQGVDFSFSPIIASGPNSCFPHAKVSDRIIKNNECVMVDFGIDVKGYKSDLTRMFFLGRIPPLIKDTNTKVETAQRLAIDKIRAGIKISDVDKMARNSLAKHRLDKFFGHALGHGVGLDIHESPRLAQTNNALLKAGMVITVEPAVYIPNKFGIRIEDMVLVTEQKCEVLSGNIDH